MKARGLVVSTSVVAITTAGEAPASTGLSFWDVGEAILWVGTAAVTACNLFKVVPKSQAHTDRRIKCAPEPAKKNDHYYCKDLCTGYNRTVDCQAECSMRPQKVLPPKPPVVPPQVLQELSVPYATAKAKRAPTGEASQKPAKGREYMRRRSAQSGRGQTPPTAAANARRVNLSSKPVPQKPVITALTPAAQAPHESSTTSGSPIEIASADAKPRETVSQPAITRPPTTIAPPPSQPTQTTALRAPDKTPPLVQTGDATANPTRRSTAPVPGVVSTDVAPKSTEKTGGSHEAKLPQPASLTLPVSRALGMAETPVASVNPPLAQPTEPIMPSPAVHTPTKMNAASSLPPHMPTPTTAGPRTPNKSPHAATKSDAAANPTRRSAAPVPGVVSTDVEPKSTEKTGGSHEAKPPQLASLTLPVSRALGMAEAPLASVNPPLAQPTEPIMPSPAVHTPTKMNAASSSHPHMPTPTTAGPRAQDKTPPLVPTGDGTANPAPKTPTQAPDVVKTVVKAGSASKSGGIPEPALPTGSSSTMPTRALSTSGPIPEVPEPSKRQTGHGVVRKPAASGASLTTALTAPISPVVTARSDATLTEGRPGSTSASEHVDPVTGVAKKAASAPIVSVEALPAKLPVPAAPHPTSHVPIVVARSIPMSSGRRASAKIQSPAASGATHRPKSPESRRPERLSSDKMTPLTSMSFVPDGKSLVTSGSNAPGATPMSSKPAPVSTLVSAKKTESPPKFPDVPSGSSISAAATKTPPSDGLPSSASGWKASAISHSGSPSMPTAAKPKAPPASPISASVGGSTSPKTSHKAPFKPIIIQPEPSIDEGISAPIAHTETKGDGGEGSTQSYKASPKPVIIPLAPSTIDGASVPTPTTSHPPYAETGSIGDVLSILPRPPYKAHPKPMIIPLDPSTIDGASVSTPTTSHPPHTETGSIGDVLSILPRPPYKAPPKPMIIPLDPSIDEGVSAPIAHTEAKGDGGEGSTQSYKASTKPVIIPFDAATVESGETSDEEFEWTQRLTQTISGYRDGKVAFWKALDGVAESSAGGGDRPPLATQKGTIARNRYNNGILMLPWEMVTPRQRQELVTTGNTGTAGGLSGSDRQKWENILSHLEIQSNHPAEVTTPSMPDEQISENLPRGEIRTNETAAEVVKAVPESRQEGSAEQKTETFGAVKPLVTDVKDRKRVVDIGQETAQQTAQKSIEIESVDHSVYTPGLIWPESLEAARRGSKQEEAGPNVLPKRMANQSMQGLNEQTVASSVKSVKSANGISTVEQRTESGLREMVARSTEDGMLRLKAEIETRRAKRSRFPGLTDGDLWNDTEQIGKEEQNTSQKAEVAL